MFWRIIGRVIRDAVLREIDRGGQVYYLYNKVDTIEQKEVSELKELIPRGFNWLCSWTDDRGAFRKYPF